MARTTTPFDAADYLDTPEAQAEYLAAAFETGEDATIKKAMGRVARARGITQIAKDTALTRQALYKGLSESGDPRLSTLLAVLRSLGLRVTVKPGAS